MVLVNPVWMTTMVLIGIDHNIHVSDPWVISVLDATKTLRDILDSAHHSLHFDLGDYVRVLHIRSSTVSCC